MRTKRIAAMTIAGLLALGGAACADDGGVETELQDTETETEPGVDTETEMETGTETES